MTGRVSDQMLAQSAIHHLQSNLSLIAELQNQASTGRKLNKPSDSPVGIGESLSIRSALSRNAQLSANIDDAEGWLGIAGSTLGAVGTQLQTINALVLQAANAGTDQNGREAIANQIDQLRQSILGLANTQYGNRPLFGGTASGSVAYDASGNYVGTAAPIERTVAPGVQVQVNVDGDTVFGPPGNSLFTTLAQISDAVRAGTSLNALGSQLKTQTQNVLTQQALTGSTYARIETIKSQNTTNASTMQQTLSNVEDVDLAQVLMNLQAQETTYQSALAAAAKAIQPSLAAFLQ